MKEELTQLVGAPFKNGGRTPEEGFDCWGLVMWVYRSVYNIDLPDLSRVSNVFDAESVFECIFENMDKGVPLTVPREPCIVLIQNHPRYVNHTGVYIGEGKFIHCLEKFGVLISHLRHWKRKIRGFYAYVGQD